MPTQNVIDGLPPNDPRLVAGCAQQARSAKVRAKFKVESYETRLSGSGPDAVEIRQVRLSVVYGDSEENKKYFKWTPSGQITMGMLNPDAWAAFELGREMYVEFTPA